MIQDNPREITSLEKLENALKIWGAEKDEKVENVWWLNGHCFKLIKQEDDTWIVEEL